MVLFRFKGSFYRLFFYKYTLYLISETNWLLLIISQYNSIYNIQKFINHNTWSQLYSDSVCICLSKSFSIWYFIKNIRVRKKSFKSVILKSLILYCFVDCSISVFKLHASRWAKILQENQYWEKCVELLRKVQTFKVQVIFDMLCAV
jgi:hypothetical protein